MIDREKVIKEFELFIKEFHPACTSEGVELDMFREVLALLKEQEAVVKCKDCKYGHQLCADYISCEISEESESGCHLSHKPEWFCADGRKKDGC